MKKTFSVLLSLLILLSSISFNLSAHYCGSQLVDIALFGQAVACPMAAEKGSDSDEIPCCADRDIIIDAEDYLSSKDLSKQEIKKTEVLIAELNYPIELLVQNEVPSIECDNYSPPLIEREIPILIQSFLL
ncbi:MAG: hypothetical protein JKY48_11845 [Flavobacteriales bacterium]|nr:hypothetical protein [Flavobacteriales bacterium]